MNESHGLCMKGEKGSMDLPLTLRLFGYISLCQRTLGSRGTQVVVDEKHSVLEMHKSVIYMRRKLLHICH